MITDYFNYLLKEARSGSVQNKGVTIVGAGRIGAWIAINLAWRGVRNFLIIDGDKVSEDNIRIEGMVPYNFFQIDQYKCSCLAKQIKMIDRRTRILILKTKLSYRMSIDYITRILGHFVVTIWAIDTVEGLKILENTDFMTPRIDIIPSMHAKVGGGKVMIYMPFMMPCPVHSLGLDSFDLIKEGEAHRSGISVYDVKIVTEATVNIVMKLLFNKVSNIATILDLKKSNYLNIQKLGDNRYRKIWIKTERKPGCILCGNNLLTN